MIPGLARDGAITAAVSLKLRRVLIVDEALPVRRKLLEILHRAGLAGAQVQTVETPESAMEAFVREHPPLVFTELVGKDSDQGLAMVLEMLQVDPHAKIVLVTAENPESTVVRQAVRAGVFAVIRKPLRHDKIRQVLSEIESEEGGIERFR
jgi:DNA-binding NtrC family response regulator